MGANCDFAISVAGTVCTLGPIVLVEKEELGPHAQDWGAPGVWQVALSPVLRFRLSKVLLRAGESRREAAEAVSAAEDLAVTGREWAKPRDWLALDRFQCKPTEHAPCRPDSGARRR